MLNGDVFLTGREFYMSGEGSGNGAGSNVQYNSLENVPSEEISGIDVLKNPEAATVAGGIGGTVDLKHAIRWDFPWVSPSAAMRAELPGDERHHAEREPGGGLQVQ